MHKLFIGPGTAYNMTRNEMYLCDRHAHVEIEGVFFSPDRNIMPENILPWKNKSTKKFQQLKVIVLHDCILFIAFGNRAWGRQSPFPVWISLACFNLASHAR